MLDKQSTSDPSARNPRIVWTGAILVTIGLSLLLLAGEWFATFDACVANPTCNAGASSDTLAGYLALIVAGVVLAVCGVVVAFYREKGPPRRAMILWL
jgi:xanthine/uracil permease